MDGSAPKLRACLEITNQEFLETLFGDAWGDAHVCAIPGNPAQGDWSGGKAQAWRRHLRADTNNYFAVSTFRGDRRIEGDFEALVVLGLDDVGPKIDGDKARSLLGEPTFRVETSPDNEQWLYRLAEPVRKVGFAKALIHAVRVALTGEEGKDPGQEGVTRYLRFPVGINGKYTPPAGVRLSHRATRSQPLQVATLGQALGLAPVNDPVWDQDKDKAPRRQPAGGVPVPEIEGDRFVRAFRELGLVLGDLRPSAMGRGFDVICPWADEHTDKAQTGAFYAPVGERKDRAFKCHHGHCDGRGAPELEARLDEMLREDSGGLVCLGSLDFDDVDPKTVRVFGGKGTKAGAGTKARVKTGNGTYELTEDGLAEAFADRFRDRLRFNHTRSRWVEWLKTRRWEPDERQRAFLWARELARELRAQEDGGKALAKIAAASAIERAARAHARIATVESDWDRDPYALAAAGMHVNLRTGAMRPLEQADLMLRSTLVAPDPGMPTPVWDQFMWETFGGDIELIEFVPQWFGYSLTGDINAEMVAFLFGTGGNGKGVLLHTVSAIAGDYASGVGSEMFMERRYAEHPAEVADLSGRRMVLGSEVEDNARWNLKRLKELTGKEVELRARFMRQDWFRFRPTHKITLVGNHKPAFGHVDKAIARRLILIPFEHEPKAPDVRLKDKLIPEYPGILWKLIQGAGEALAALDQPGGLWSLVPQSVVLASREYLVEEDTMMLWLSEEGEFDARASVRCAEAYDVYTVWCGSENRVPVSLRGFGAEVKRAASLLSKSLIILHQNVGNVFKGMRLKPDTT